MINLKHVVLFIELDYGLMCYEHLAIRWFSMYVGDVNICFFDLLTNAVFVNGVESVWWIVWLVLWSWQVPYPVVVVTRGRSIKRE